VRAVIDARKRAAGCGAKVLLVVGTDQVRRLLTLTGVDRAMEVYPSVDEGLGRGAP
jgi:hypothetical protein